MKNKGDIDVPGDTAKSKDVVKEIVQDETKS
jgi:hypothetical protein